MQSKDKSRLRRHAFLPRPSKIAAHPCRPILHALRFKDTSVVLEARAEPSNRADSSHQLLHDMSIAVRLGLRLIPSHIATWPAGSAKEQFLKLRHVRMLLLRIATRNSSACTTEIELWERSKVRRCPTPLVILGIGPRSRDAVEVGEWGSRSPDVYDSSALALRDSPGVSTPPLLNLSLQSCGTTHHSAV